VAGAESFPRLPPGAGGETGFCTRLFVVPIKYRVGALTRAERKHPLMKGDMQRRNESQASNARFR
jgi:hypothetical protein